MSDLPARVLVADPSPIFRAAVSRLLSEHGFSVGEAATTCDLIEAATAESGQVLALVDLDLPPSGGLEAVSQLVVRGDVKAILWGNSATPEHVLEAVRVGAAGFLRKEISSEGLVRALEGLAHGQAPLGRELTQSLIDALQRETGPVAVADRTRSLSLREREVLEFLVTGAHNKQIGSVLEISEFTVKRHVQNILRKLGVPTRHAAATLYIAAKQQLVNGQREGVAS